MAEIAERLSNLNPFFKGKPRRNTDEEEDIGEEIDSGTVAGGGHSSVSKGQLRVSNSLKSFLVGKGILALSDAGIDLEELTEPMRNLLVKPHILVPKELMDRSYPLPEYFISSSHNTYLIAHQLYGSSSASGYETALCTGSRCVEIDAWDQDDSKDEPKVTHGYTLVSNVSFRSVCETIRDVVDREAAEFTGQQRYRPAPILISLENHCGPYGQKRLVEIMHEVWGDRLLSREIRGKGHEEEANLGEHVKLEELGSKIAVIVEFHLQGEVDNSDSDSCSADELDKEEKRARQEYKKKKKSAASAIIIPELADLGVYAQSVKPSDNSWYSQAKLANGPHHHLINVSESGVLAHLPANSQAISRHNAQHLMRVYPKGTRISSGNLGPVKYWGIGAQICALNCQHFGTSNQINEALFSGSDGYILKPAALRAGGTGNCNTGRRKKLRLHVGGATDIPLNGRTDDNPIKPYLTCSLYHPDDLKNCPPKRKTAAYKQHKLGFLHQGENPPPTDPVWDEVLEWEYDDNELVFLRFLVKSDDPWARNPAFAVTAVRLLYVVPGWSFIRLLDMMGHETGCTILVRFEFEDI